jgi:hypothetical protein
MKSSKMLCAALALWLTSVSGVPAQEIRYLGRDASGAKGHIEWGAKQYYEVEQGTVIAGKGTVTELTDSQLTLRRVLTEAEKAGLRSRGAAVYDIEEVIIPQGLILVPPR